MFESEFTQVELEIMNDVIEIRPDLKQNWEDFKEVIEYKVSKKCETCKEPTVGVVSQCCNCNYPKEK